MGRSEHPRQRDDAPPAQPFDFLTPVRFPFCIGQLVRHRADSESRGVVVWLGASLCGCVVGVSWGPVGDDVAWHFVLEAHYDDDEADHVPDRNIELPFEFGARVRHRAKDDDGVVTGYRICERGVSVRVAWSADHWDLHDLCEIEPKELA